MMICRRAIPRRPEFVARPSSSSRSSGARALFEAAAAAADNNNAYNNDRHDSQPWPSCRTSDTRRRRRRRRVRRPTRRQNAPPSRQGVDSASSSKCNLRNCSWSGSSWLEAGGSGRAHGEASNLWRRLRATTIGSIGAAGGQLLGRRRPTKLAARCLIGGRAAAATTFHGSRSRTTPPRPRPRLRRVPMMRTQTRRLR